MSRSDLWTLSATVIANGVRARRWSAREVLAVHLERVEQVESTVHAFSTLTPEIAEAQADAVDDAVANGLDPGPLAGVPIGIKDMLLTAGVRTTFGSAMFENNVPDVDEPVVRQVRHAGAVMFGKTNVPEFAFSSVGHSPIFETTTNPWDPSKTSGGSSAGSAAAIAAGECPIALGADRAGSIRIPAAHCGIVGFKPTKGIVPDNGTNDSLTTTGPMARTVADAELLLSVLAGFSEADPHSVPVGSLPSLRRGGSTPPRVGVSLDWGYAPVDAQVRNTVSAAADLMANVLGWRTEEFTAPWEDPWDHFLALAVAGIDLKASRQRLPEFEQKMTPHVVAALKREWTAEGIASAHAARLALCQHVAGLFDRFDLLVTPTVAVPPFGLLTQGPEKIDGQIIDPLKWIPFTFPFNMTGHPAASLPAGWTADGLPIGVQLVARRFADADLLDACRSYEAAAPWLDRWSPMAAALGSG
jgi:aspartyl-tRNA(Asn)/glutamyl-tRNA(Gln) amidotransferase subunit A